MQKPYEPPKPEHDMICPNCGSTNVSIDESNEVKNNHNQKLKEFVCGDCKAHFIPAMTESDQSKIGNWAVKMRTKEGMNEGRCWRKEQCDYIIILPKKDM